MRRPPRVVVIAPRIRAGLDRDEAVVAVRVAEGAAEAGEIQIKWRRVLIAIVTIATCRIRLPHFDQRVRNRLIVFIQHAAADDDTFADRLAIVLPR